MEAINITTNYLNGKSIIYNFTLYSYHVGKINISKDYCLMNQKNVDFMERLYKNIEGFLEKENENYNRE